MIGKQKLPRDFNQRAKFIVDTLTGSIDTTKVADKPKAKKSKKDCKEMTSHELANKLLEMPNVTVFIAVNEKANKDTFRAQYIRDIVSNFETHPNAIVIRGTIEQIK